MSSKSRRAIPSHADVESDSPKRQKLRKGTFSCWECKRRKTRCEFRHKSTAVCVSCQRRGTSCVGQEFPDPDEGEDSGVEKRIVEVESLVAQLVQQRTQQRSISHTESEIETSWGSVSRQRYGLGSQDKSNWSLPPLLATVQRPLPGSISLSSQLHKALPHPTEVALIMNLGKFSNLPIHVRGQPSKKEISPTVGAQLLAQASELPPATAHPVQFARKLVQLALCLHQQEQPVYDVAQRYVDIASRYVTSQDFLMESMEGLEVLMLQSLYHVNTGTTRRAWLVVRRALTIAQLLGLPEAKEADSRSENVWFRLVLGDRSLSWMLGLPAAVYDNTFSDEHELVPDAWSAKLERVHAVVFGLVIERNLRMVRRRLRNHSGKTNDSIFDDCKVTKTIDHKLKKAARLLPSQWWLCPFLENGSAQLDVMEKTEQVLAQMHHYFLVVIIHQPYFVGMSWPDLTTSSALPTHSPFDDSYCQVAVHSASRDVLSRFLVLRSYHDTLSYRGVDDKAFVACVMFVLVHISGHSLGRTNVLEHQRPHDLGMMHEVLEVLEKTSSANKDTLGASMVQVLKHLMGIEAHSANGGHCRIWLEGVLPESGSCEVGEDDNGLRLPIPYFGLLRISRQGTREVQARDDLVLDAACMTPFGEGLAERSEREYTLDMTNAGGPIVPSMVALQPQCALASNRAMDYDENLYLQRSLEVDMQISSQMPALVVPSMPRLNQETVSPIQQTQNIEVSTLNSWLELEAVDERYRVEADM